MMELELELAELRFKMLDWFLKSNYITNTVLYIISFMYMLNIFMNKHLAQINYLFSGPLPTKTVLILTNS